jgi:hypothetical protein
MPMIAPKPGRERSGRRLTKPRRQASDGLVTLDYPECRLEWRERPRLAVLIGKDGHVEPAALPIPSFARVGRVGRHSRRGGQEEREGGKDGGHGLILVPIFKLAKSRLC